MIQDMEGMAITALASRSESSRQRILAQLELDVPAFTSLDELLEKVHRQGIGSLTPAEKRFLDKASAELRGRDRR